MVPVCPFVQALAPAFRVPRRCDCQSDSDAQNHSARHLSAADLEVTGETEPGTLGYETVYDVSHEIGMCDKKKVRGYYVQIAVDTEFNHPKYFTEFSTRRPRYRGSF